MLAQSILLEFVRAVDPYGRPSGTAIAAANIHSQEGEKWTVQQRLDIYNQARFALLNAMLGAFPGKALLEESGALTQNKTDWTWTLSGSTSSAPKPTGYIDFINAATAANVPMILLGNEFIGVVPEGENPNYIQSASNIHIFEMGTNFINFGTFVTSASTYKLRYIGLSVLVIADITTASAVSESFNDRYYTSLIELATLISGGASEAEAIAIAKTKLRG
jgi:hypothetical protein